MPVLRRVAAWLLWSVLLSTIFAFAQRKIVGSRKLAASGTELFYAVMNSKRIASVRGTNGILST